ncbi:hypothetical protein [Escherichia coli]|uniref:hypothetical protein n=1 Tax=Escherichia coli TaxID=562 RepID=UPI002449D9FA|nr:hypothetical protein [Escherichia coli]
MGKELDDICTSCPYIDAVKRHKQQLGAIEEYTQWLKKEPRASYFFLFQLRIFMKGDHSITSIEIG